VFVVCLDVCTIPTIDNGHLETNGQVLYNLGDRVAVRCDDTYVPVSQTTTCHANRTWDPRPLCANITCSVPDIKHGKIFFNDQSINAGIMLSSGSVIQLICSAGYTQETAAPSITCQNTGQWSEPVPNCTHISCSEFPPAFENGDYDYGVHSQPFQYNHTLSPFCHEGFYLQHGGYRQCTEMNLWSGDTAVCSPITCPSPNSFSHGRYNGSQTMYSYGVVLVPICDTGYYIANNVNEQVCEEKHTWSGDTPVCNIVQCSRPLVENGLPLSNATIYNYSKQITIECYKGYEIKDGAYIRTCQKDGTWGSQPMVCDKIICNDTSDVMHKAIPAFPLLALGDDHHVTFETSLFFITSGTTDVKCSWDGKLMWILPPTFGI